VIRRYAGVYEKKQNDFYAAYSFEKREKTLKKI
jgi:hypothetical protein